MPELIALATAVPPYELHQEDIAAEAHNFFPERLSELQRLMPVYKNAGIGKRYSCRPLADYRRTGSWKEKNSSYLASAVELLEDATLRCLEEAKLQAGDIDAIVAVSTTGLATPSLDAQLMNRLPFRSDVERLPIFGLGCAGGVLGLARAAALARARPGAKVLFLVVELCALTFRQQDQSNANIVATALFGDGAAAAIVSSGENGHGHESCGTELPAPRIAHWGEHTWPNSLDVMGWSVEDDGLGVIFSQDIPSIVLRKMRGALDGYLARHGLVRSDIDGFITHPGGTKVIHALERALDLQSGTLRSARDVLWNFGNMSAATVLFVLAEERKKGIYGRQVMTALGPGFTAAFLTLEGKDARPPRLDAGTVAAQ